MRAPFDQAEIKQQLSKFINLLQTDFNPNPVSTPPEPRTSCHQNPLQKKLSIIFSASEPESSSLDKENSNPSANRSFDSNEKQWIDGSPQQVLSTLMASSLTPSQIKLAQRLREMIESMRLQSERLGCQLQQCKSELSAEKKANDEMLNVLVKLDEQEKQLWGNYNSLSQKYQDMTEQNKIMQVEFQKAKQSLFALQNDNDFMKKLIYHANENYEALEKRCHDLETHRQRGEPMTDRKSIKKSSTDNLLKSAKTRKNGCSPSHSELGRSPSPQNFQEIYRKMIIRTLKFKGKSSNHH